MTGTSDALRRLGRRILMAVGRGRVTAVDDSGNVQVLQVQLGANEVRDRTPRLAEYGVASNPPPGSDAVAIFVGGDRSNGVIIATGSQVDRLRNLAPGEVALYDHIGKYIWLQASGLVIEAKGQGVTINNTSQATVNGPTTINGNLNVNGTVTATGEGTFAGGHTVSQHTHTQGDDTHGDGEVPTDKPQG